MQLIHILTKQLGITEQQAEGGAGLLFKMAKEKLGPEAFGQVAGAIPGVENLIASAPKPGGIGGALGGLTASMGGSAGKLGSLAALADGFKGLNMDSGLIAKFIPTILAYVESKGGTAIKTTLEKALR